MAAARQPIVFPNSTAEHLRSFAARMQDCTDKELARHRERWHSLAMNVGTLESTPGVDALLRLVHEECDILDAEHRKRQPLGVAEHMEHVYTGRE